MLHIVHDGTGNLIGNIIVNKLATLLKILRCNFNLHGIRFSQQPMKIDKGVFYGFFTQTIPLSSDADPYSQSGSSYQNGLFYSKTSIKQIHPKEQYFPLESHSHVRAC